MLVKLADCILNGMECQEISAVVARDLSAAFDTVNISVLVSAFHNYYGITGDVLKWVESYLTDQSCSVMINGKKSPPKHLTLSVPQGSCSGAYFFIMYAATLFEIVQEVDLFRFADDHILINTFKAGDRLSEMNSIINLENALINTKTWMDDVKLKMNPDKTEFIYFGFRTQISKCLINSIDVVGDEIERSGVIRYLGGFLDTQFSLRSHVTKKCAIASGNLAKIRSICKFLTQEACEIVINSLVTSHMDYVNGILLNVPDVSIKPYQCLQNMSAKRTLNRRKHSSTTEALKILHWLPVRTRINFKILSLTHQCIHGTAPDYLKSLINLRKPSNLNSKYNLKTPFNKHKTFGDRSFSGGHPPME